MKKRVLAIILLVALVLSAFVPAATATAPPSRLEQAMQSVAQATQGVMQAQGVSEMWPFGEDYFEWTSEEVVIVPVGTPHVDVTFYFDGSAPKAVTELSLITTSEDTAIPLTFPPTSTNTVVSQSPWGSPIQTRPFPHMAVPRWDHGAFGATATSGYITVRVLIPANAEAGILGTVSTQSIPGVHRNNLMINEATAPVQPSDSTTIIMMGNSYTLTLHAGTGGTFLPADVPAGWTPATGGATISRAIVAGTPWESINFPMPVRAIEDDITFNSWREARPTGLVDDDFESTALWNQPGDTHTITLNAGIGGTWPTPAPEGWERSANGILLTRVVADGTPWESIDFPTPARATADGFTLLAWDPAQPTGLVEADFASTAQWNPGEDQHLIVLRAGNGGTYATAPADWTRAVDGSYIFRAVATGTAWDSITFPLPGRATADDITFNVWAPARPAGTVDANFDSTAQWNEDGGDTHTITLNAGIGGTWPAMVPAEWTRVSDTQVTRTVAVNTPWASIIFPIPARATADGFTFLAWNPAQPTGLVDDDFASTAQWEPPTDQQLIVLNAGDGGTYAAAPTGWTRAVDGSYIWSTVATGTAWDDITFPLPGRVDPTDDYEFDGWDPAQPTTGNITARFESTAQWDDDLEPSETRTITLNAGIGGTWPATAPEGWERSANGILLTREVEVGTPWANITFPTPARVNPADDFTFLAWDPVQPTGDVADNFASTAQWRPDGGYHLIVLRAGNGGTYATAPADWTLAVDGTYIFRTAAPGTAWNTINFPLPGRLVADDITFNVWAPARPTGTVDANFDSTAQWNPTDPGDTRTITLNAGIGGEFPATVSPEWTRVSDAQLTRTVAVNTPWASIEFPAPARVTADGFTFDVWSPIQPTGLVEADFASTAEWNPPAGQQLIVLNAGDGGTYTAAPAGWTRAVDGSYIWSTVVTGTPWDGITFPLPGRVDPTDDYEFDGWDPAQPTTGNITARFESTAQWDDDLGSGETRTITLNAGIGGTWPTPAPEGWERSANGLLLTREVEVGTPWASITFPTPARVAEDGFTFLAWNPVQPTGLVTENFASTARWTPDGDNHLIALRAGLGGVFNAPAPAGWTRAGDGSYIFRVVPAGTPWDSITFTLPVRATTDGITFNVWDEARPTGNVEADFEATALWNPADTGRTHTVLLNAGIGGTFPTDVPEEWTRSADGTEVTRTVTNGTPWNLIDFPLPVRLAPEGFVRAGWTLDRPIGTVNADFASIALWNAPANRVEILLHAGTGGTFNGITLSEAAGWAPAANGSYIATLVDIGTAWNTIVFPEPVRLDPTDDYEFDGWNPAQPAAGNITARFESTAQWDDDGGPVPTDHLITLNAGNGGIFPTEVPTGWTRSANGAQLTRTVATGTPWAGINFPLPVRLAEDNIAFNVWSALRPTGNVNADFTSTALWMSSPTAETRTITLNAGIGGIFSAPAPAEWTRAANGFQLTRTVEVGTPWNLIGFPTPVRVVANDGFTFFAWSPVQPTGDVANNFASTAQWRDAYGNPPSIIIDVEDDRSVEITNRPPGTDIEGDGSNDIGDITVTFPPGTPPGNIVVNVPDGWTYTNPEADNAGNVVVVITPPIAGLYSTVRFHSGHPGVAPTTQTVNVTPTATSTFQDVFRAGSTMHNPALQNLGNHPSGYYFQGWFTQAGGLGTRMTATTPFTTATTYTDLYAHWASTPPQPPLPPDYPGLPGAGARTITFALNGGNISGNTANVVHPIPANGTMALTNVPANPVQTGQIFMGWLETTPAGTEAVLQGNDALVARINATTGNRTFTAQWAAERTITFNLNGGNNNAANVVHTITAAQSVVSPNFGIALTDIPQNPTRTGQFFLGWLETTPLGNEVHWERNEIFVTYIRNSVGNRTFTAQWGDTRTITFNLDGGNIRGNTANVLHNIPFANAVAPNFGIVLNNVPENPARLGYTFTGWLETTPTGNTTVFQRTEAFATYIRGTQGNRTFTAQWEEGRIPVSGDHRAFLVGFPDNTMRPTAALTRAEAATIFFRLIDDEFRALPTTWRTSNNFADVLTENWFNNAISTMSQLGVIHGVSSTTFAPNRSVTNGEFFAMLARFNRLVDGDTASVTSGGHWAEVYARALEEANLISGFSGNATRLDAPITRASVAELINRAVTERVVENRDHLINTGPLRRNWADLSATSPHYLNMVMAGHTVEYDIVNTNTAGDWNGIRWTRIVRHIDWTVLEGPNANPQAILRAVAAQQAETAVIERNEAVEAALDVEDSL